MWLTQTTTWTSEAGICSCRNDFDRQFYRSAHEKLVSLDTNNPNKFWEYVKTLSPATENKESVFEVYDD